MSKSKTKDTKKSSQKQASKSTSKKKKTQKKSSDSMMTFITSYILLGILMPIIIFSNDNAFILNVIRSVLLGLFGKCVLLVPVLFIGLSVYLIKIRNIKRFKLKTLFGFLTVMLISSVVHLLDSVLIPLSQAYDYAASAGVFSYSKGGGLAGALIAAPLADTLSKPVAFILIFAFLIFILSVFTGYSILGSTGGFLSGLFSAMKEEFDNVDVEKSYKSGSSAGKKAGTKTVKKVKQVRQHYIDNQEYIDESIMNEALDFYEDEKKSSEKESKKIENKPVIKKSEAAPLPQNEKKGEFQNGIDEIFGDMFDDDNEQSDFTEEHQTNDDSLYADDNQDTSSPQPEQKQPAKPLSETEKDVMSQEIDKSLEESFEKEYVFPDTDLLDFHDETDTDSRKEMYETANKLISILDNFGVKAKLLQVTQGPSVTRYEIQPNTGVKLSKITGLAEDLALNLAVQNVLVAAVPGKAAVGIEVPNREVGAVYAREILESEAFENSKSKLTVALGKDIGGRVVVGDIAKMPHVLIAGSTGSGKSVCINTILTSILYKASPDEVKLILVDPKVVELGVYNGIPHLLIPVVTDPKRAAGALNWAVAEMMHRYDIFASNSVRNLSGYNALAEKKGMDKLPQIVIVIDELADLMMVASKEVEDYVCRLAQLARAAGIHLIIATQRPSVDVITGLIKANIPSRIAFAVSSQVDSRTILDKGGAEKLLGRGDMLYFPTGMRVPLRVQGAFVSDDEIERILDFVRSNCEDSHYSEDLSEHIERCSAGDNGVADDEDDDGDELLPQAIALAAELGQISTAMIQRRLKVGYSRAGRIIDQMEERGIIGGANGSKPRQVYVNRSDVMFND